MEIKQDRSSNITFSLHDTRIKSIIFKDNKSILKADKIFKYTNAGEKIYSGEIVFGDSDLDECSVLIFDKVVYEGKNISRKRVLRILHYNNISANM